MKMDKIQKKRLLNVARALRESKVPKDFSMACFVNDCGTPACALGHYASRRDLQREFDLTDTGAVCNSDGLKVRVGSLILDWLGDALPHFGLSPRETSELFTGDGCGNAKTVKQAARYIERFVARKEKAQAKEKR